jgi:hypothetical protein
LQPFSEVSTTGNQLLLRNHKNSPIKNPTQLTPTLTIRSCKNEDSTAFKNYKKKLIKFEIAEK